MEILELTLMSDHLKKTEEFYREKLGLILIKKTGSSLSFTAGRTVLNFIQSKNLRPVYHFAFNIPCNQFSNAVTWASLKLQLLTVDDNNVIADFKNWNARSFYFFDNNGNILEFIARFDLKNARENHFSGSSILSVSEIGLVTDNILQTVEHFSNAYGLEAYQKQPLLDNFAALGDANGLLILSTKGRNWYPTNVPAMAFPCSVSALINNKVIDISV